MLPDMKNFRVSIILITIITAGCSSGSPAGDTSADPNDMPYALVDSLPRGNFGADSEGSFSGDLTLRGYVDITRVQEPFCVEDCETFSYATFKILEASNEELADFLLMNEGNAYAAGDAIGLGCVDDGIIHYSNHSDAQQMKEYVLPPEVSAAILASTENEPVMLHLKKLPLSGGTEAPACYSHFTTMSVVQ